MKTRFPPAFTIPFVLMISTATAAAAEGGIDLSAVDGATRAECARLIGSAIVAGVVRELADRDGSKTVIVNENLWNRMQFQAKVGLATTASCAFANEGRGTWIDFRSDITDKVIGIWRWSASRGGNLEIK